MWPGWSRHRLPGSTEEEQPGNTSRSAPNQDAGAVCVLPTPHIYMHVSSRFLIFRVGKGMVQGCTDGGEGAGTKPLIPWGYAHWPPPGLHWSGQGLRQLLPRMWPVMGGCRAWSSSPSRPHGTFIGEESPRGNQNLLWELMYSGDLPGPRGRASS